MKNCKLQIESLESQYLSRMDALKDTVASKTAVPTSQVYVCLLICYFTPVYASRCFCCCLFSVYTSKFVTLPSLLLALMFVAHIDINWPFKYEK